MAWPYRECHLSSMWWTFAFSWLLLASLTHGFFPSDLREHTVGNGGVSHASQTRTMFEDLAVEFWPVLKVKGLTGSMNRARKTISDANEGVDNDQDHSAKHFDGENFEGGQYVLTGDEPSNIAAAFPTGRLPDEEVNLIDKVQKALQKGDGFSARQALGRALHTLQDFYAHTNYIEIEVGNGKPNPEPHPGVGVRGAKISHARPDDSTCGGCSDFPSDGCPCDTLSSDLLSSGYYVGEDRAGHGGKCNHGGYFDKPHSSIFGHNVAYLEAWAFGLGHAANGINKDSLDCDWSPHGPDYHRTAVSVSIEASKKFVRSLRDDYLNEKELKLLFGVGPSLAFVIDTTGSMGDVIDSVRQQAIQIINDRVGSSSLDDEPIQYVLVPYNDPDLGAVVTTSDPDEFKIAIDGLSAAGGGDCPEPSMAGLLAALNVVDEGASLLLFTDASAKDAASSGAVVSAATRRKVSIYAFSFASGCSADPIYDTISDGTTGHYFPLPRSDVNKISGLLNALLRPDLVEMLNIINTLGATGLAGRADASYDVPVDSAMSQITFILSGDATMNIVRPDGDTVGASDAGATIVLFTSGSFTTVVNPSIGKWRVSVAATGKFALSVSGVSKTQFTSFDLVKIGGRPGHEGYFPIDGPPISGQVNGVLAYLDGGFDTAKFELRTQEGAFLKDIDIKPGTGNFGAPPVNSFFGTLTLPAGSALVYVSGMDKKGTQYQRVYPLVVAATKGNATSSSSSPSHTSTPSGGLHPSSGVHTSANTTYNGHGSGYAHSTGYAYSTGHTYSTGYTHSTGYAHPTGHAYPTGYSYPSGYIAPTAIPPYPYHTETDRKPISAPTEVYGPDITTVT